MMTEGMEMNDFAPTVEPKSGKKIAFILHGTVKEVFVAVGAKQYTVFGKNLPCVWAVKMDGPELPQFALGACPVWAPDRAKVSFSTDHSGNWDIWRLTPVLPE